MAMEIGQVQKCAAFLALNIDVVEKLLQHAILTMEGLRGEWFGRRGREESVTRCGECLLIATHPSEHIWLNEEVWSSYPWQRQTSYPLEYNPIAEA